MTGFLLRMPQMHSFERMSGIWGTEISEAWIPPCKCFGRRVQLFRCLCRLLLVCFFLPSPLGLSQAVFLRLSHFSVQLYVTNRFRSLNGHSKCIKKKNASQDPSKIERAFPRPRLSCSTGVPRPVCCSFNHRSCSSLFGP